MDSNDSNPGMHILQDINCHNAGSFETTNKFANFMLHEYWKISQCIRFHILNWFATCALFEWESRFAPW